jgi:hypothetical protein
MKKVLLSLLGIVVALGLLGAAGFAGYRYGFAQGARMSVNANATRPEQPGFRPFDDSGRRVMPSQPFGNGFNRGMRRGFGGFPLLGFGFFGPLMFLGRILVFALIVWFVYWLFARSGWRLTRAAPVTTAPPVSVTPPPAAPAAENENTATDVNP